MASDIQKSGEKGDVRLILGVSEYWDGVKDGLYLALTEARLSYTKVLLIRRLKELVDDAEKGQFLRIQELLKEIGRGA
jgi:hypothetical protein